MMLHLPGELRNKVYDHLLDVDDGTTIEALRLTCHQSKAEIEGRAVRKANQATQTVTNIATEAGIPVRIPMATTYTEACCLTMSFSLEAVTDKWWMYHADVNFYARLNPKFFEHVPCFTRKMVITFHDDRVDGNDPNDIRCGRAMHTFLDTIPACIPWSRLECLHRVDIRFQGLVSSDPQDPFDTTHILCMEMMDWQIDDFKWMCFDCENDPRAMAWVKVREVPELGKDDCKPEGKKKVREARYWDAYRQRVMSQTERQFLTST
jgi:hypothetical protein